MFYFHLKRVGLLFHWDFYTLAPLLSFSLETMGHFRYQLSQLFHSLSTITTISIELNFTTPLNKSINVFIIIMYRHNIFVSICKMHNKNCYLLPIRIFVSGGRLNCVLPSLLLHEYK